MRICVTFQEEAERERTGDQQRVIGITQSLAKLGHEVYLIEHAPDSSSFVHKGIKIVHVKSLFAKSGQLKRYARKLLSVIDSITHVVGLVSKFSSMLLDDPFVTLKTIAIMRQSDLVLAMGDLSFSPLIAAKMLRKKVFLDVIGFYLLSVYRMRMNVPYHSFYGILALHASLGKFTYYLADKVVVPSLDDAQQVMSIFKLSERKVAVIPNGMDTDLFRPDAESREKTRNLLGLKSGDTMVLFLGGDPGLPNMSAVDYIVNVLAPSIRAKHDNVFFVITGSWVGYQGHPNIRITGYVDDVVGYINAADLCIAPLSIGSGTKIKMLAYMACGKVIVATPVAAEGIKVADDEQMLVRDISTFADEVLYAIENKATLANLAKNARTYVETHFSWSRISQEINKLIVS